MSDPNSKNPYVIKRVKKIIHKNHGGSWKIAYADFVTAMMTFFLLMWLLSLLNKYQLQGISNYFKKPMQEVFTKQDTDPNRSVYDPKEGSQLYPSEGQPIKPVPNSPFPGAAQNQSTSADGKPDQANADMKAQTANNVSKGQAGMKNSDEMMTLTQLKQKLEADLEKDGLSEYKNNLNFTITSNGLRIDLHDLQNKPMFSQGKLDFKKYAAKLLDWLGAELNKYPNRILIIGHTDSLPYRGDEYSNWELSADRANMTRKMLEESSMDKDKVIRVIGVSDTSPLDSSNRTNAINRRIEIIVLTKDAADSIGKN